MVFPPPQKKPTNLTGLYISIDFCCFNWCEWVDGCSRGVTLQETRLGRRGWCLALTADWFLVTSACSKWKVRVSHPGTALRRASGSHSHKYESEAFHTREQSRRVHISWGSVPFTPGAKRNLQRQVGSVAFWTITWWVILSTRKSGTPSIHIWAGGTLFFCLQCEKGLDYSQDWRLLVVCSVYSWPQLRSLVIDTVQCAYSSWLWYFISHQWTFELQ